MRSRGIVLPVVLLAVLAGCAHLPGDLAAVFTDPLQDPAAPTVSAPARPATERRPVRAEPAARAGLPGVYGPPGVARAAEGRPAEIHAAAVATVPPMSGRRPFAEAAELIGLERGEVRARLGPPTVTRSDAPAEIWQYRTPVCVLDLVLYAEGGATRVAHADMRRRDGRAVAAASCLASF